MYRRRSDGDPVTSDTSSGENSTHLTDPTTSDARLGLPLSLNCLRTVDSAGPRAGISEIDMSTRNGPPFDPTSASRRAKRFVPSASCCHEIISRSERVRNDRVVPRTNTASSMFVFPAPFGPCRIVTPGERRISSDS